MNTQNSTIAAVVAEPASPLNPSTAATIATPPNTAAHRNMVALLASS
jgi:hypothetical protein